MTRCINVGPKVNSCPLFNLVIIMLPNVEFSGPAQLRGPLERLIMQFFNFEMNSGCRTIGVNTFIPIVVSCISINFGNKTVVTLVAIE